MVLRLEDGGSCGVRCFFVINFFFLIVNNFID